MSETAEAVGRTVSKAGTIPRVLVLDDEADLRELIELTLVGMGLDVDCAADLGQARGLAKLCVCRSLVLGGCGEVAHSGC